MQRQTIEHHNSQADKTIEGQGQGSPAHAQKLHDEAYARAGHPITPEQQRHQEEKLKVERTQELMHSFKKMDSNHDGKVTVDELVNYDQANLKKALTSYVKSVSKTDMAALDSNHDGKVTLKEYEKARASSHETTKQLEAEFKARDTNGDGYITFSEIKNFHYRQNEDLQTGILKAVENSDRANFKTWDVNHDGKLNLAEYIAPNISIPMSLAAAAESVAPPASASGSSRDAVGGAAAAAGAEMTAHPAVAADDLPKPAKSKHP